MEEAPIYTSVSADKHGDNAAGGPTEKPKDGPRTDLEKQKTSAGEAHFHRLGWKRLTIVLIVEAIALGSLSLPAAFATLGMVAGVICCVGMGLVAIYTSHIIGQVKLKYPEVSHYGAAMGLIMGRFGFELGSAMFVLQLILLVGSHCLTGTIAFTHIIESDTCSIAFGVVSAIILLLLAIPPSFTEMAVLGYIDFASILLAIGITMIATGIDATSPNTPANWSAWPRDGITFVDAFIAITSIVFAYSFAMCQFSFLDEMHTPEDYIKSIWTLGLTQIVIYTLTGSIIYAFVGIDVKSPALLSAGDLISKIAFGVALPVIFISGSINSTVCCRYLHGRIFKNSIARYINTPKGWVTWLGTLTIVTGLAFITAEAIPIFTDILAVCSSLFVSGFSLYLPAAMWFKLIKQGSWYSRKNLVNSLLSAFCFVIGIVVLVCGTYASVVDIASYPPAVNLRSKHFQTGITKGVFTCEPIG
ncbi:transmembrane amino acid transporter protein-domain-containing protein [Dactylonectria macrodidyma]|uniref:Transmembrane amino acid transporter protein-domain-containing protein n=1 Tax=Dactylonectria macrodidyma TaxID=307937 RepID=A0A9P9DDK4_9HYPO|nr:transmembrane amino acid transporter protein-domain-containing protein [Dactylonectria macrodidyma]